MGTCISKCCLNSSSSYANKPSSPPQDKLVISQFPSLPTNSSSSSSLSSSSSSSSLKLSSSSTFSTTSTCSPSSPTSAPKRPFYSNDSLISCAKQNPHIIILNPHKYDATKPHYSPRPPLIPTKPIAREQPKQSLVLPSSKKRPRSTPPPIARQKSFKSDSRSATLVNPTRKLASGIIKDEPKVQPCIANSNGTSIAEDIDNPLISMECFIFL